MSTLSIPPRVCHAFRIVWTQLTFRETGTEQNKSNLIDLTKELEKAHLVRHMGTKHTREHSLLVCITMHAVYFHVFANEDIRAACCSQTMFAYLTIPPTSSCCRLMLLRQGLTFSLGADEQGHPGHERRPLLPGGGGHHHKGRSPEEERGPDQHAHTLCSEEVR